MKMKLIKPTVITLVLGSIFILCSAYAMSAKPVDFSGWSAYANSLATCKPGSFSLPDPARAELSLNNTPANAKQDLIYFTINGQDILGSCGVNFWTQYADLMMPSSNRINTYSNCKFNKADLLQVIQYSQGVASSNIQNGAMYIRIIHADCINSSKAITLSPSFS